MQAITGSVAYAPFKLRHVPSFSWNAAGKGGWTCKGGPSLIENYQGKPTRFGAGFKRHLRKLGA